MQSKTICSDLEQPLAFASCEKRLFVLCKDPENRNQYDALSMKGDSLVVSIDATSGEERIIAREIAGDLMAASDDYIACAGQNHVQVVKTDGSGALECPIPILIRAILIDGDTLFVAHREFNAPRDPGAVSALHMKTGEISKVCSVPLVTIQALAANESTLFFHTGQNIYRVERGSGKAEQYFSADEGIRAQIHHDGFLYFVTSEGLTKIADSDGKSERLAAFDFGPCRIMHACRSHLLILSPRYRSSRADSGGTRDNLPTIWRVSVGDGRVDSVFTLDAEPAAQRGGDFRQRLALSRLIPKIIGMGGDGGDLIVCSSEGSGSIRRICGALDRSGAGGC